MESKLSFDSGKQQMHQVHALYSDMRQGTEPAGMGCAEYRLPYNSECIPEPQY